MGWYYGFRPYVSVAQRRAKAKRELAKLEEKTRQKISPVVIEGRKIATTFWGMAWCDNLESYSDFANRLPRGRMYVRNGSVCDLQIEPGKVSAQVCGSELYRITIKIKPLADAVWKDVKRQCAGQIGSLVELLQGKLSKGVMEVVTRRDGGLFPKPKEIEKSCSCPDWADMCKHVAATLYGIGARLDHQPELLFRLRQVDHMELIAQAGEAPLAATAAAGKKTIASDALADVFGIEMEAVPPSEPDRAEAGKPVARRHSRAAKDTASPAANAPAAAKTPASKHRGSKSPDRGRRAEAPARRARLGAAAKQLRPDDPPRRKRAIAARHS
jgi:uncharacterized Zn finger protein